MPPPNRTRLGDIRGGGGRGDRAGPHRLDGHPPRTRQTHRHPPQRPRALADVPTDGDPDELLGATQAALLGFKSVNSFSSSLTQGDLPLLTTLDALTEMRG